MHQLIKPIAFFLPQFHPIPENDLAWGKGFTEWNNVVKAKPRFKGHYQPQLPADLGFYDLRLTDVREAQAKLAQQYGIYGFCYYHYWFNGKRLLHQPVDAILATQSPNFPFCLCWANENWTRRWDGQDREVIQEQQYSEADDVKHIQWLAKAFADPRYIRVQGKPLFMVYKLSLLPNPARTLTRWRAEAKRLGIGDLYICNVEMSASEHQLANKYDINGAVEFAPDFTLMPIARPTGLIHPRVPRLLHKLGLTRKPPEPDWVYSYQSMMQSMLSKPQPTYTRFPCVTPSWDNTSRRQNGATIFHGNTPEKYQQWLETTIKRVRSLPQEPLVFINAWNEWAEGNHLEPCQKHGHAYLQATKQALDNTNQQPA